MSVCCCSMAGTAVCKYCSNNPNAERPPVVRTYATTATDQVLISGKMTNADKIRSMTDEEMAKFLCDDNCELCVSIYYPNCEACRLNWLKQEVEE